MVNKLINISVAFLCLFSQINLSAQFECDSEGFPYILQSNTSKIISSDCPKSRCVGKIIWEDGTNYSGSIENSKMEGKGVLEVPNQYKYEGEFKKGEKEGLGKIIFENGTSYHGEWKFGKKEGFGAFVFPCGLEYLGNFKNDKMHGEGVLRMSEKESFSGLWENGKIQGLGTHFRKDGSKFTGEYKKGEPNGHGMIVWESKDTMRGIWNEGLLDDLSHFQFENGSSIIQFWKKGKIQKKAIYIQKDGFNISGTPDKMVKMVLQSRLNNNDSLGSNFSLAWYVAAMEYKTQNDYLGASEQLKYAQLFLDPFEETSISNLLEIEIQNVAKEKERSGVAQKGKEKVKNQ